MKAALLEKQWEIPKDATDEQLTEYAKRVAAEFTYGSNMRGSAEYRQHLAEVLLRREMRSILDEYNAEEKWDGSTVYPEWKESKYRDRCRYSPVESSA